MSKDKKSSQLGMNVGTASHRLVKDILWSLIVKTGQDNCCKCSQPMERSNFSIEHVIPWLHSEDPLKLFFDLDNISFSHLKCNVADRRVMNKAPCGTDSSYRGGCKCELCTNAHAAYRRKKYDPEKRSLKYKAKGY